jgi:hypothetical protein
MIRPPQQVERQISLPEFTQNSTIFSSTTPGVAVDDQATRCSPGSTGKGSCRGRDYSYFLSARIHIPPDRSKPVRKYPKDLLPAGFTIQGPDGNGMQGQRGGIRLYTRHRSGSWIRSYSGAGNLRHLAHLVPVSLKLRGAGHCRRGKQTAVSQGTHMDFLHVAENESLVMAFAGARPTVPCSKTWAGLTSRYLELAGATGMAARADDFSLVRDSFTVSAAVFGVVGGNAATGSVSAFLVSHSPPLPLRRRGGWQCALRCGFGGER